MLAVAGDAFDSDEHLFEPKWDGIRCIVFGGPSIRLQSRSLRDISDAFPEIVDAPMLGGSKRWILDGELVCLDSAGRPSFDAVRNRLLHRHPVRVRRAVEESPAHFVAFDLIADEGTSWMERPLQERRERLRSVLRPGPRLILCPGITGEGRRLFERLTAEGWEGIVAKALSSPYLPGQRSPHWVKVRRRAVEHFAIVGLIPKGEHDLASLALAKATPERRLRYVGHVGSGLSNAVRSHLRHTLVPIAEPPPLEHLPQGEVLRETLWVHPRETCRVAFLEYTRDGHLRHPVFEGLTGTSARPSIVGLALPPDDRNSPEGG